MSIYREFKPTYLYIKQHSITGKLYFGKTVSKNPEKYEGSGKLWTRHIKKHGKEYIVTLWYELFYSKESIQEFALSFSKDMNIVESTQWLNLIPENGTDGGSLPGKDNHKYGKPGWKRPEEYRLLHSIMMTGDGNSFAGKTHSEISLSKMRGPRGKQTTGLCPHCGKIGGLSNMKRFHFNNCKFKG